MRTVRVVLPHRLRSWPEAEGSFSERRYTFKSRKGAVAARSAAGPALAAVRRLKAACVGGPGPDGTCYLQGLFSDVPIVAVASVVSHRSDWSDSWPRTSVRRPKA